MRPHTKYIFQTPKNKNCFCFENQWRFLCSRKYPSVKTVSPNEGISRFEFHDLKWPTLLDKHYNIRQYLPVDTSHERMFYPRSCVVLQGNWWFNNRKWLYIRKSDDADLSCGNSILSYVMRHIPNKIWAWNPERTTVEDCSVSSTAFNSDKQAVLQLQKGDRQLARRCLIQKY